MLGEGCYDLKVFDICVTVNGLYDTGHYPYEWVTGMLHARHPYSGKGAIDYQVSWETFP
jgi:hypothetical protein